MLISPSPAPHSPFFFVLPSFFPTLFGFSVIPTRARPWTLFALSAFLAFICACVSPPWFLRRLRLRPWCLRNLRVWRWFFAQFMPPGLGFCAIYAPGLVFLRFSGPLVFARFWTSGFCAKGGLVGGGVVLLRANRSGGDQGQTQHVGKIS